MNVSMVKEPAWVLLVLWIMGFAWGAILGFGICQRMGDCHDTRSKIMSEVRQISGHDFR